MMTLVSSTGAEALDLPIIGLSLYSVCPEKCAFAANHQQGAEDDEVRSHCQIHLQRHEAHTWSPLLKR